MIKRFGTLAAALALTAAFAAPALASTPSQTASVTVNGSVTQSCTAFTPQSDTLTFPAYDSFANASTALPASNHLDFTTQCTKGAKSVTWTVDGGKNYGSAKTSGDRAMASPSTGDFLDYNLYSDSTFLQPWDFSTSDGSGTAVSLGTIASSSTVQHLTIYGREPAGQDPSVATDYTDKVTIAVNY